MLAPTIEKYRGIEYLSISGVCRLIGVNRQKYYRRVWHDSRNRDKATEVVDAVEQVRMEMPRIGTRKLYKMLGPRLKTLGVGRDKLFSVLKANHMLVEPVRSYHVTTNSHHRFRKHKNMVSDMEVTRPEQVWVSDITYIGNRTNHLYLALITDAYSKKIVGYDLSESLSTAGSLRALKMAKRNRLYPNEQLIHHSDRGIQYCSDAYQNLLRNYNMTTSMTETYDPYANAVAERINGILKQEFLLEEINLAYGKMKYAVKCAIETYNDKRPHFSCDYNTPNWMHQQCYIKIKTFKKTFKSSEVNL